MINIEDLYYPCDILTELKKQSDEFNLFNFYTSNVGEIGISNYGGCIITPRQMFYCYANKDHADLMENILFALYGDNYNYIHPMLDYDWKKTGNKLGNICMQLMSQYYSLVWLPSTINEYQRDELMMFCNSIKDINKFLKSNNYPLIDLSFCFFNNNEYDEKSMDWVISNIDGIISNSVKYEELIVNSTNDNQKRLIINKKFN